MNVGEMQRKLSAWAEQDKDHRFFDLFHLVHDTDWLWLAHDYVAQNAGSVTAGCDGITMDDFDEHLPGNLQKLAADLKTGAFEARPVRRVYIPKANGKMRPLGIPAIRDRIVQEALRMILEPIYEADFVQHSYGFRPGRCTMDAMRCILWAATGPRKYFWVIEGDIRSYFDTIHHRTLMQLLRRRVADNRLLDLIWQFLRAGVMERKLFHATTEGTPQGGIISPLLANVYLHELDRFMDKYTNLTEAAKARRRRQGMMNCVHVRYADDFVVMCNGTRAQAEDIRKELFQFLHDRLHLTLSEEKTRLTHLNDGFRFLGFQVKRGRGKTAMVTRLLIPRDAASRHLDQIRTITAAGTCQDSVATKIQALNRVIGGWCRYYQYTVCSRTFARLSQKTWWYFGHWLGRKFKKKIRLAGKPYRTDGTYAVGKIRLLLHHDFKRPAGTMAFHKPNPYTTRQQKVSREELPRYTDYWTGHETRLGQADLRLQAFARDGYVCFFCQKAVTEQTAEAHHVRAVRNFKRPVEANYLDNFVTACLDCHRRKTEEDRQLESRMR